jgi:hypothetical protein
MSVLIIGEAMSNSNDDYVFGHREEHAPIVGPNTVVAFEGAAHRLGTRNLGPVGEAMRDRINADPN